MSRSREASGLSGVRLSTVYHWARTGVVGRSVSPTREMLWSNADLYAELKVTDEELVSRVVSCFTAQ